MDEIAKAIESHGSRGGELNYFSSRRMFVYAVSEPCGIGIVNVTVSGAFYTVQ